MQLVHNTKNKNKTNNKQTNTPTDKQIKNKRNKQCIQARFEPVLLLLYGIWKIFFWSKYMNQLLKMENKMKFAYTAKTAVLNLTPVGVNRGPHQLVLDFTLIWCQM